MAIFAVLLSNLQADQIVMKNGDRVSGTIVKKDSKNLTIKTASFGTVTTAWDQVDSVKSDAPVTVVLQDGRTVQGTVTTEGGRIAVAASGAPVLVAPAEITAIRNADEQKAYERLMHPGWGQLWTGTANIGWAGTAGNARTLTFTTGMNAVRVTNTDKTSLYFNAVKASATISGKSAETAQAVRGGVAYDHNLSSKLFATAFNDYEYDRFQNLDLRFVLGGGVGYHAIKNERMVLDLPVGADYNRSTFSTPLTRSSAELFWGDDFSYKLRGTSSLVQSYRMFNDLTNTGTYRVNFDLGVATKFTKWLNWNVSLSDRYLNHPAPGRKTNDILYTTGLGFTFAR